MSRRVLELRWCLALCASGIAMTASADERGPAGWQPVSEARLDAARGGFDWGGGLVASLGIDRAVYLNGTLVTSLHIQLPDVGHLSAVQAGALSSAIDAASVLQVGPGNTVDPSALSTPLAATLVQNTLDNQHIATQTTLDVSVNSLGAFRSLNLQQSLQAATANPLGR